MGNTVMKRIMPAMYTLATILASTAALAEEEGHAEPMTFMGDWLPRLVNFAIIAGVVIYFTRKPIRDFFKNRTADIAKAIQESKEDRERPVAALAEMKQKTNAFEEEAGQLITQASESGDQYRQH